MLYTAPQQSKQHIKLSVRVLYQILADQIVKYISERFNFIWKLEDQNFTPYHSGFPLNYVYSGLL